MVPRFVTKFAHHSSALNTFVTTVCAAHLAAQTVNAARRINRFVSLTKVLAVLRMRPMFVVNIVAQKTPCAAMANKLVATRQKSAVAISAARRDKRVANPRMARSQCVATREARVAQMVTMF